MWHRGRMQTEEATTLRAPANLVSRRAVTLWTVEALVPVTGLLVAQVVWWLADDDPDRGVHWLVGAAWLLVSVAYVLVMPRWRWRVHRWEATGRAIYTQTGWVRQERRIAPMSRVQTVDLERGPIAQLLGLASVTVTTASAAGPLRIHALDLPVATELVETLSAAAVVEKGDAT